MSRSAHSSLSGVPHAGPGQHREGRSATRTIGYRLCGTIRHLAPDDTTMTVEVDDGHGHSAGRFCGERLLVQTEKARFTGVADDQVVWHGLRVGDRVCVRARLPFTLTETPEVVCANRVELLRAAPVAPAGLLGGALSRRKLKRHPHAADRLQPVVEVP